MYIAGTISRLRPSPFFTRDPPNLKLVGTRLKQIGNCRPRVFSSSFLCSDKEFPDLSLRFKITRTFWVERQWEVQGKKISGMDQKGLRFRPPPSASFSMSFHWKKAVDSTYRNIKINLRCDNQRKKELIVRGKIKLTQFIDPIILSSDELCSVEIAPIVLGYISRFNGIRLDFTRMTKLRSTLSSQTKYYQERKHW